MTYPAAVLADVPELYWRLGEASGTAAADTSGEGHSGTYIGSPTLGAAGLLTADANTAVTFANTNVTDEHVETDIPFPPVTLTAFSLETIVRFDDLREAYGYQFLCGFYNGTTIDVELNLSNIGAGDNELSFIWLSDTSNGHTAASGLPAATGIRYHVCVVYDGTDTILYVNGVAVATDSSNPGDLVAIDGTFSAGNDTLAVGDGMAGTQDEVAFYYDVALSPSRVAAHYAAMIAGGGGGVAYTPVTVVLNNFAFDDGVTESPAGVAWCWQDLSGWFDTADQRYEAPEIGLGTSVTVDRRNGRPITLTVLCHNPSDGLQLNDLLYAAERALKAAVRAAVDVPVLLKVNEPTIPLQAYVRQAAPIRTKMIGTRHMVQFQIPLIAPDPRRYAQTAQSVNLTSGTTTVTNNGDLPSPGVFTITGTSPNPQIRNTTLSDGPQIIYGGTLGGGDTLVIDVAQQTVKLNGSDARSALTVAHWWEFKAGGNAILVNNNTNIVFRDAYS